MAIVAHVLVVSMTRKGCEEAFWMCKASYGCVKPQEPSKGQGNQGWLPSSSHTASLEVFCLKKGCVFLPHKGIYGWTGTGRVTEKQSDAYLCVSTISKELE